MSYFNSFPRIYYQFDDELIKVYNDISTRAIPVEEILKYYSNLETYVIREGETPESIAYRLYDDTKLHWTIMLVNNILNMYTDWPLDEKTLTDKLVEEYRTDDSLTDDEVKEILYFKGTPENDYTGTVGSLTIRPYCMEDADGNYYSLESYTITEDARGRSIDAELLPDLTPVSHWDYHNRINDSKREIYVPTESVARKMNKELRALTNG